MSNPAAADSVVQLMKEASEANFEDSFRNGSIIEFPGDGDLLMTGDLHGNHKNYMKVVEKAGLSRNRKRHLILHEIIHSLTHTADGLDMSYQVFEMAARLKVYFPDQVHFLMGNHDIGDLLMLDILKGGQSALKGMERGLAVAYGEGKDEVRASYHEFIQSMPVAARTATGIFISHSIPQMKYLDMFSLEVFHRRIEPEELSRDGYVYRLVWGRQFTQEAADAFAEKVNADLLICGHQPLEDGYALPNSRQMILDSKDDKGCYAMIPLEEKLSLNKLVTNVRRIRTHQPVL